VFVDSRFLGFLGGSKIICDIVCDIVSSSKLFYDFKSFGIIFSSKESFDKIICDLRSFSVVRGIS